MAKSPRSLEQAFGQVVRSARERAGLSQEELGDACHLHRTYISQIERGLKSPSLSAMHRIASGLGMSLDLIVRRACEIHAGER